MPADGATSNGSRIIIGKNQRCNGPWVALPAGTYELYWTGVQVNGGSFGYYVNGVRTSLGGFASPQIISSSSYLWSTEFELSNPNNYNIEVDPIRVRQIN